MIKHSRNQAIITPNYADHIHREHFPFHAFYRCKISGWHWKVQDLTSDNFPQQIFPESDAFQ
jgi:hypothetical protein